MDELMSERMRGRVSMDWQESRQIKGKTRLQSKGKRARQKLIHEFILGQYRLKWGKPHFRAQHYLDVNQLLSTQ